MDILHHLTILDVFSNFPSNTIQRKSLLITIGSGSPFDYSFLTFLIGKLFLLCGEI
jgi:hypothetical protein